MRTFCLLPLRSFAIPLTAAAALMLAVSPSGAQQRPVPSPQLAPLPPTVRHPLAPGTSTLAIPSNAPGPTTLLNLSSWSALGPASLNSNGFLSAGADLVSGRIAGVAVDPTDSNTIYIAAAGGGVWKTSDGGTTWSPLTDDQPTLSMGSIAVAPSNHLKIYAGTGEANNSLDSNRGMGILVSNDGGATWTLSSGGGALVGEAVGQIAVDPANENVAYAAVGGYGLLNRYYADQGIYKTTDGGTTWTNVTAGLALPNSTNSKTVDWSSVVVDPNTSTIVYAAIGDYFGGVSNGIYRSMDSGATWTLLANAPHGALLKLGRIALAVSPAAKTTGQHVLYIAAANHGNSGLGYFLRSDNADAATPTVTDLTTGTPDFLGGENNPGQGWYDIAMNVDANGNVYCSGVENYGGGGTQAIITSSTLGVTWNDISIVNGVEPHTDNHAIAFDSKNRMLAGNDGGIYRYDPTIPSWTDLNNGLNTIQFQGVSLHPTAIGTVLGGAQDNGTELYSNNLVWVQDAGGDGGPPKISQTNPLHCYHEYYGGYVERSDDGCQTFTVAIYNGLHAHSNRFNFYTPYALDPSNGDHIVFGTDFVNESTTAGNTWVAIGTPGVNSFNPADKGIDSVAISPVNGPNPAVVYAATGGSFATTSNIFVANPNGAATTWTKVNLPACTQDFYNAVGCRVNQIVTDPNDVTGKTAFAVVNDYASGSGGHVFMTSNEGGTWSDISGNLPNVPVWSIQIDTDADKTAYIAADAGVYSAPSPYSTWTLYGTGLPNAQGYDLELNSSLHVLAIGTHGRGAWEILTPGAQLPLTAAKTGVGTGTVSSAPAGINCGSTCTANFPASSLVNLTATAGANSAFTGWTGCDTVSQAGVCGVNLVTTRTVTANFSALPTVTWPTASAITYGQALSASTLTGGSASFNSTTVSGTFAFDSPTTAPTAGVQSEAVTFTPTDTATYSSVHGTVNVTVNQAVPTITWAAPAAIPYGTALSATQLNATASVPGTFVYAPAAGTVLAAGAQNLQATFTPTDAVNYTSNTKTVQLTVNKAALTVKADNQSITYGGTLPTLTGTLTGVVTGDGITATFSTTATSASTVGQYPITATLNDPNTKLANYSVTNTAGTLTVGQATPVITWTAPAAITYGTALGATQLNASSSVPGAFAYSPASGTVLGAGSQTLKTTFTPTDATDYATVTGSVQLTVNQATPAIALASSVNPATPGQAVTFTATVSSSAGTPTGSVTFWDGTTQIGSGTLSAGVATFSTTTLALGAHSITAQYSGDANFATVTSTAVAEAVSAFSIGTANGGSSTGSGAPGGFVSYQLTVTPPSNSSVTFTVTGLPPGFTASFSPSTVAAGAGPTTVTLTVHIPSQVASAQVPVRPGTSSRMPVALGLLLLPLLGLGRRGRRLSRLLLLAILAVAGLGVTLGLSGCSHNFSSFNSTNNNPPSPGSYTLTVTATAGAQTQSTNLTLKVQ